LEVAITSDPKHHSRTITDGRDLIGTRAMLKGVAFTDDDLARPMIGVVNTWTETLPCNYHLVGLLHPYS
jgi:dihydroxy-acid dehydratase